MSRPGRGIPIATAGDPAAWAVVGVSSLVVAVLVLIVWHGDWYWVPDDQNVPRTRPGSPSAKDADDRSR
ncbi:hypothetical protein GCM10014713_03310 [Streptomyces purpureus]|uniref:Uncharacterized protein n=1 Tax=Streptomyces purpureus TaxID=1951 RepID=A0A918GW69_9ACTN|nr:hypothetical protein GCM10014713_03310 [Streptomyces purpureus]